MGTVKKGILGGFSGKVGIVVGVNWKGGTYVRSLPKKAKNAPSLGQLKQRSKFALVQNLLQPLSEVLRVGWKLYAHDKSTFNAATSYTLTNAVSGEYPDFKIELSKVLISRGELTAVTNAFVNFSDGQVIFQWEDNSGAGSAKATDRALIAIVNLTKGKAVTITAGAPRSDSVQNVASPSEWSGDEIHTYMGFASENGREVSNSVYLGAISVK